MLRVLFAVALLMPALVTGGKAHEFWIEPEKYQVAEGEALRAATRNGQNFKGQSLSWFDKRNVRVDQVTGGETMAIEGRAGDNPAIQITPEDPGLVVLVHQAAPTLLTYDDWDIVLDFAAHKDFPWFVERHADRGLPRDGVKEVYSRYSKSLVAIGDGAGMDAPTGLEVEIVALANPYTDDLSGGFPIRVIYRDQPRPDAQVEVFDKAPDGTVTTTRLRTDGAGEVRVPVTPGHSYLLDHVILREPDPATDKAEQAMWESLWASLTFAVPD